MPNDTIPRGFVALDGFQGKYIAKVVATPGTYGHSPQDVTQLQAAQSVWTPAYANWLKTKDAFEKAELVLEEAEKGLIPALRSSIRKVNAVPGVDNALRTSVYLAPHAAGRSTAGAPLTWPLAHVNDMGGHRHESHWVDKDSPLSKAKPEGVDACEIFLKIGDPAPVDETTCTRIARDTATPYLYEFNVADVGKTAYWLYRWVNRADEHGPFGPVVSAKIT